MSRTVFCPEEVIVVSKGKEDIGRLVALGNDGKFDTSVIPVIDELQTQITAEVTARSEADTQLQSNIDAEALARTNADAKLQSNVDVEASARSSADQDLQDKITAEVTARTNADNQLQTSIDAEITARIDADQDLQDQMSKEVADRTNADNILQANIDVEANSRAASDEDLQEQLTKEVAARTDGDTALQSSVDAEVTARTNADEAESSTRASADKDLQEQLDVLKGKSAFSNVVVNGTTIQADSQTDTIELEAGTNIALTADAINEKVTIAVTGKVTSAAQADSANTAESCTGNAATATKLEEAHTINGVAFDGSADITITQVDGKTIATTDQISTSLAASSITNTPNGDISSTDVQAALNELDSDKLSMANSLDSGAMYHYRDVAAYGGLTPTLITGTLKIALPTSWNNTILRILIQGVRHVYASPYDSENWSADIKGYNGNSGISTNIWVTTSVVLSPNCPFTSVRFGHDGTNCCILLGTTTTAWGVPQITISDVFASNTNNSLYASGWAMSFITDETDITVSATPIPKTIATLAGGTFTGAITIAPNSTSCARIGDDAMGSIELGDLDGSATAGTKIPYIDFHYATGAHQDYNIRLINNRDGGLCFAGNTTNATELDVYGLENGYRHGFMLGSKGIYGYLDYDTSHSAVRLSGYGPLVFGHNTNEAHNSETFTEHMRITTAGNVGIGTTTPNYLLDVAGIIVPHTDNAYTLGAASYRFSTVYAATSTIATSDERVKTDITDSGLGLDFINALRPVSYKFKVGSNSVTTAEDGTESVTPVAGKRTHYGMIAQEVKTTLGDTDFGGYIYDSDSDTYGLRYEEFISPLIKAVQELSVKVTEQATTIAMLQAKLNS